MDSLKPIRWQEGMFLRPQHLQQFDRQVELREIARFQAVERPAWGLIDLRLDVPALANQQFRAESLRAVLPDGTYIDVPGNAQLAQRSFADHATEPGRPLAIHLGVRVPERGTSHVAGHAAAGRGPRFTSREEETYDTDSGGDVTVVERLVYEAQAFFGDEPTVGYETLPLARIVRTGDPAKPVLVDHEFSAPSLSLAAGESLRRHAREVVEILTQTVRELGQQRGRADPDPLILYQALSGCVPVLRDMVNDGQVHPRAVHHEMARLAGALFYRDRAGRTAEEVPLYDHAKPGPVFRRLRDLIFELSRIVIKLRFLRIPFERHGDDFYLPFPADAKQPGCAFYLEPVARESASTVGRFIRAAKISAPHRIPFLRDHAMPGIPNEPMPGPPGELPPGQKNPFFRLQIQHPEWRDYVLPSADMIAFVLSAPPDLAMNLVVVLPEG